MNNSRVSPCKYSDILYVCSLFQACFTATTHLFTDTFIYLLLYLFLWFFLGLIASALLQLCRPLSHGGLLTDCLCYGC